MREMYGINDEFAKGFVANDSILKSTAGYSKYRRVHVTMFSLNRLYNISTRVGMINDDCLSTNV